MGNKKFDPAIDKKARLVQRVEEREDEQESKLMRAGESAPLQAPVAAAPDAHAALLRQVASAEPSRTGLVARGLQRRYGNRYVTQVVTRARHNEDGAFEADEEVEEGIQRARGGGQALDGGAQGAARAGDRRRLQRRAGPHRPPG